MAWKLIIKPDIAIGKLVYRSKEEAEARAKALEEEDIVHTVKVVEVKEE